MTERGQKILNGKRERALSALTDENRIFPHGFVTITSDEAKTLSKWIVELKKGQEPKPVVYTDNPYTGLPVAHCPKCCEYIQLYAYGNGAEQNHCPYCGQAVKWE